MIDAIFRSTFRFEYLILGPKSYRDFRETGPLVGLTSAGDLADNSFQYQDRSLPKENLVQHH